MLCLHIEDIIANSIIELNKMNGSRSVSIKVAERYGEEVIRYLRKTGYQAVMNLGRDRTYRFEEEYADFFTIRCYDKTREYILKDNKSREDLIQEFRGYLPLDLLLAFTNAKIIRTLCDSLDCANGFEKGKHEFSPCEKVEDIPSFSETSEVIRRSKLVRKRKSTQY